MTGLYETKDLIRIFKVSRRTVENRIRVGLIPTPIQPTQGGKRYWPTKQIDRIANGEAA